MDPALALSAIGAGILTFFSPCSFPMLPAYLTFYLGLNEEANTGTETGTVKRGLLNGVISTSAFLLIFSIFGIITSLFSSYINPYMRYIEPVVGVILVILGVLFAFGKGFSFHVTVKDPKKGIFSFSLLYALAAVGCTLPVFISIVLFSLTGGGFLSAFVTFLLYALGMSAMMIVINLLIAFAKQGAVNAIRKNMGVIRAISAAFMIGVGSYLIYYYFDAWVLV
ncbi:MAG: cytochrome c biogenesis protein CcdA [Candidatus Thermoplasmatota archaeon]|nr:cytochrome c biogenesis protein CcdA [Candidatus Thermoplasmatota archaeon]